METLTENTVYRMDLNGHIGVALASDWNEGLRIESNSVRIFYISPTTKRTKTASGLRFERGEDSYVEFSPLTLEVAHEIYPDTKRVFNDLSVLEKFARRDIDMAESYEENVAPEEVISFTVDDQENVVDLIKVTDTGDLFHWVGEDWVEVGPDDDAPTVFDQEVIDVEREDIGTALDMWKDSLTNGTPLTKEDILTVAALDQ